MDDSEGGKRKTLEPESENPDFNYMRPNHSQRAGAVPVVEKMRMTEEQHQERIRRLAETAISRKAALSEGKGSATAFKAPKTAPTGLQRMQALGRLKAGEMNKTEAAYYAHLAERQALGGVAWFKFEGLKYRLGDNTFFTPDFAVMLSNGQLEAHEVKGHWVEDARVKIKVAASMYPINFIAVKKLPKSKGGGWEIENF